MYIYIYIYKHGVGASSVPGKNDHWSVILYVCIFARETNLVFGQILFPWCNLSTSLQTMTKGDIFPSHYNDVIISEMASQITSVAIIFSNIYSGADQRKHQRSTSLASARGIHRWPVNSPHKRPVTQKMLQFDDVIMIWLNMFPCKGWEISSV